MAWWQWLVVGVVWSLVVYTFGFLWARHYYRRECACQAADARREARARRDAFVQAFLAEQERHRAASNPVLDARRRRVAAGEFKDDTAGA